MKRSKSSPGKGPGSRKGKSDKSFSSKRGFSKSSGSSDSRRGAKHYGNVRSETTGRDKKSFVEKPGERGVRFDREKGPFEKRNFNRTSERSVGKNFSAPAGRGDRPERFKKEGDSSDRGEFKRSSARPPGRNFSSPSRGGDRPDRFKREGDRSERGAFKRSSDKPSGGTYLRRKDDRPERIRNESDSSVRPKFERPDREYSAPRSREEKTPLRESRSESKPEKFSERRKRARIGDRNKTFDKRGDKGAEGKFKSPRSTQRSDSPRSYGEKRYEVKPIKEKKRGSFEKRPSGERGERPWNRKEKHEFYGDRKKKSTEFLKPSPDGSIRLNRFIANAGVCSRREADELIEAGVISVNGEVITEMGYKVMPTDNVKYNNELLRGERLIYILLNKPKDFITTTDDPEDRKTVMSLIAKACKERVYPVGRLDRNTTGVLLFTNDGDLAKKLTHPSFEVHKVYQVELDRSLKNSDLDVITEGIKLDDGFIKPDEIVYTSADKNVIGVEIHSGKNRIVRRIFEHVGYEVKKLDRVVFAGLTKKDLPRGRWRFLTDMEIANLKMITGKKKLVN